MDHKVEKKVLHTNEELSNSANEKKAFTEQEYVNISESQEFKTLSKRKAKFIVPMSITFLVLYFLLPLLSSFTQVLDGKAIGHVTWIWIYSLGLFIMVWTFTVIYVKKAATFDKAADEINAKAKAGDYK